MRQNMNLLSFELGRKARRKKHAKLSNNPFDSEKQQHEYNQWLTGFRFETGQRTFRLMNELRKNKK